MRPRLLDTYSCEGGAAQGYIDAGFDVTAVDIEGRFAKRNPAREFVVADAVEFIKEHGHEFDVIHASPPCQAYSITKHSHGKSHPELIEPTREALIATGTPYIIENVVGAPLINPLTLCGTQFNLSANDTDGRPLFLRRHRLFESNVYLWSPGPCRCVDFKDWGYGVGGVYGGGSADRTHAKEVRRGGYTPGKDVRAALIGADWMTLHGLSQSIPPAYTRYLGEQLIDQITRERVSA